MKNVFDIRKENDNYVILSSIMSVETTISDVVVIIYLYYADTVSSYYKYIDSVSDQNGVDTVFITSSDDVESILHEKYPDKRIIRKENRGRDVAALLISAKEEILKHKYFCFVHDKKPVKTKFKSDAELWIRNMWENILASEQYVRNVINYLELNPECGLMVPPEPFGDYYCSWFRNSWQDDFDNTIELARKLSIHADISNDCSPISLGTVLCGRTEAIKKLIEYPWEYEDFDKEPLPSDGTISHAIERIFPYVAQDAGYDTRTVMTTEFCSTLLSFAQSYAFSAYSTMRKYLELVNVKDMKNLSLFEERLGDFFQRKSGVYLYGAGAGGRACLHILHVNGLYPAGFIVSKLNKETAINGLPVMALEDANLSNECGVIITVIKHDTQQEMVRELETYPNVEYIIWHDLGE